MRILKITHHIAWFVIRWTTQRFIYSNFEFRDLPMFFIIKAQRGYHWLHCDSAATVGAEVARGGVQCFGHRASRRRTGRRSIDRVALCYSIIYYQKYGGVVRHAVVNLVVRHAHAMASKQLWVQRGKLLPPFPPCCFLGPS